MSMFQKQKYDGPKPSMFPLVIDTRPKKTWKIDSNQASFGEMLNQNLNEVKIIGRKCILGQRIVKTIHSV